MDILLIVACLYMAYANINTLVQTPFAEWELVHYVMVVLTVLLVVVGALKGWQYYKKRKAKAAEGPDPEATGEDGPDVQQIEAEEPAKAGPEAVSEAAPAPPRPEPPVDVTGLEDWEIETADFNYTLVELPEDDKK